MGRYCGNSLPDAVNTSDSFAYVKFVTDGSINARGFRLSFDSSTEGWIFKVASSFQGSTIYQTIIALIKHILQITYSWSGLYLLFNLNSG